MTDLSKMNSPSVDESAVQGTDSLGPREDSSSLEFSASASTVEYLWSRARLYSKGDPEDREFGAGMQEVLRLLGVAEPKAESK